MNNSYGGLRQVTCTKNILLVQNLMTKISFLVKVHKIKQLRNPFVILGSGVYHDVFPNGRLRTFNIQNMTELLEKASNVRDQLCNSLFQ